MKSSIIQLLTVLSLLLCCNQNMKAQNVMRITQKNGAHVDVALTDIDSVTFISVEKPEEQVTLVGTWYWESQEQGYSETLTFNADGSFTCLDHYFGYGFDSSTYGTYMFFGSILNLHSNGFGYSRNYQWMVTELTDSRLTVLTKMGSYTYTKIKL